MSDLRHNEVFRRHPRDWRSNLYVYPVISRRSKGLSIGVNLNPDKACNFDCIYCQVDRSTPPVVRKVDVDVLRRELGDMLALAIDGQLYDDVHFGQVPEPLRRLNDIAFSGDGEPTTCPQFPEAVDIASDLLEHHGLNDTRLILITDACYLTRPAVVRVLEVFDRRNGEIWAKLDAGTEKYYQLINRPNYPLSHVLENIFSAASRRPVVIQALFMRVHDEPPPPGEIEAFCDRLNELSTRGAQFKLVQVYTVARRTTEPYVAALRDDEIDALCHTVRQRTGLPVEGYYGG